jgi:hypothetical protein
MENIPFERIIKVEKDQLIYLDDRGDYARIDLLSCANSYKAQYVLQNNINPDYDRSILCVGERYFGGDCAYFELYTIGHTRFYLKMKSTLWTRVLDKIGWNWRSKYFTRFYSFQKMLNSAGYTTLDLN